MQKTKDETRLQKFEENEESKRVNSARKAANSRVKATRMIANSILQAKRATMSQPQVTYVGEQKGRPSRCFGLKVYIVVYQVIHIPGDGLMIKPITVAVGNQRYVGFKTNTQRGQKPIYRLV